MHLKHLNMLNTIRILWNYLLRPTSEVDGIAIDKVNGTAGWFSTREYVEGVIACGRFLQ